MPGNKAARARGATLLELAVVITLAGLIAAAGALMIGQMAPGYALAAETEQTMAATHAALWFLRRDFAMTTSTSPNKGTTCYLTLNQTGGSIAWQLDAQGHLLRNGDVLLEGLSTTCPFKPNNNQQTLQIAFTVTGASGQASLPVSLTLASYER